MAIMGKARDIAVKNWPMLAIVLIVAGVVWMWQSRTSAKAETEALKATIRLEKQLEDQRAKLEAIEKREKELYPAIEARLTNLEKRRLEVETRRAKLDNAIPGIRERGETATAKEVIEGFELLGYPCKGMQ